MLFRSRFGIPVSDTGSAEWRSTLLEYSASAQRQPPVHFEDGPSHLGECVVCGRRGALHACDLCGQLSHLTCIAPKEHGGEPACTRCEGGSLALPGLADYAGIGLHGSQRLRWKKGALNDPKAEVATTEDPASDDLKVFPHLAVVEQEFCELDARPSVQDAINHGYSSPWKSFEASVQHANVDPTTIREN